MLKKLIKHFLFFTFLACNLIFNFFSARAMDNEEDFKQEASINSPFKSIPLQKKECLNEDLIKLETYLTNLQNYKIGVKKISFPEEKKLNLFLNLQAGFLLF